MAKKTKQLCKWKQEDIMKKFDKYTDIVRNPKFVCTKCGRVADKKNGCTKQLHSSSKFWQHFIWHLIGCFYLPLLEKLYFVAVTWRGSYVL
jgi:hypothetical protein